MKINVIYDDNGNQQLIYEKEENTQSGSDFHMDSLLTSIKKGNEIRINLKEALNSENTVNIKAALKTFYTHVLSDKPSFKSKQAEKRVALLEFFLDNLENPTQEPRRFNIKNMSFWLNFLRKEKLNDNMLILSLWLRRYENETLQLLNKVGLTIDENLYQDFFEHFEKHIIYDDDCYSEIQKKRSMDIHQQKFFEIMIIERYNELDKKLNVNQAEKSKPKI